MALQRRTQSHLIELAEVGGPYKTNVVSPCSLPDAWFDSGYMFTHQLDDFLNLIFFHAGGRGSSDRFSSCSLSPLAGVFNASDNLGKLHRVESRPKCRQLLVNLVWNGHANVWRSIMKENGNRSPRVSRTEIHGDKQPLARSSRTTSSHYCRQAQAHFWKPRRRSATTRTGALLHPLRPPLQPKLNWRCRRERY